MLIYFGTHYTAERVGGRVVGLRCDKCGCEYYYQLVRVGSGAGVAPFDLGMASAERAASDESQQDLQNQLAGEAELVPCPQCHWINEELVQGYRNGMHKGYLSGFAFAGFIGVFLSLFCGFLLVSPSRDAWLMWLLCVGGPIFFALLPVGWVCVDKWLRSQLQPNRYYPAPPVVPPGTPPALVLDPGTGTLQLARLGSGPVVGDDWQDIQLGRHTLPQRCCHCLQYATSEKAYRIPVQELLALPIPRCTDCARTSQRKGLGIWAVSALIAALFVYTAISIAQLESLALSLTIVGIFLAFMILPIVLIRMLRPFKVSKAHVSRGVLRIRFSNPEYGRVVAEYLRQSDGR